MVQSHGVLDQDFVVRAIELENAEDWLDLLEHGRRWAEVESFNSLAWYILGIAYGELSRHDEAVATYHEALRIHPEYADTWNNL